MAALSHAFPELEFPPTKFKTVPSKKRESEKRGAGRAE